MDTLRNGAFPEFVKPGEWKVKRGPARIDIRRRVLELPDDPQRTYLAHELAHAHWSPEIADPDEYVQALEDCRINQWLARCAGIDVATEDQETVIRVVERLHKQGQVTRAILVLLSVGRHTYPVDEHNPWKPEERALLNRLGRVVFDLLEPSNGKPVPHKRVTNLAATLREALDKPIDFSRLLHAGEPEKGKDKPVGPGAGGIAGAIGLSGSMTISEPDRTRDHRKVHNLRPRTEGAVPLRFDRLPIDGSIFRHRRRSFQRGSVLIDASGSMHLTAEQIASIVKQLPFGVVAYYSAEMASGVLTIAARNGRMIDGELPNSGNCNVVDAPALQWLSEQPMPRYHVSDCGWTAKGDQQPMGFKDTLRAFCEESAIEIVPKVADLLTAVGGKSAQKD